MEHVDELPHAVETYENVWIPVAEGIRLAARVWVPGGAAEAPVPGVLEYIPYRKRDLTRVRDTEMHHYLAGHGYGCVRVDMRGSGDSDGLLVDEYLESELSDGEAVLAWIAAQEWCSGTVGMIGKSWGGFNGLQLAARRPPELGAIVTVCSTDDRYADDVHYMGGCLLGDNLSWASAMFAHTTCPPDPEVVGERWRAQWLERIDRCEPWLDTWLRHPFRDDYWKHGSVCEDIDAIECPVLAVSGWADGYTNAVFRLLEDLPGPRRGLIGPWSHRYPHRAEPGPAIGFLQEVLAWFDRWLKGVEGGPDEPMLRAWRQDSVEPTARHTFRPGGWVAEEAWPSERIERHRWSLGFARLLPPGADEPDDGPDLTVQSPLTVGLYAGKWCSYSGAPDMPHDQREDDGGSLVFDSPPLSAPLDLLGAPIVDLELVADRPVAMVAARLSDLAPDGSATRISYGVLNLTHRDSHENPEPLEPGTPFRASLRLNDIAQRFPEGHRLRLSISTSYWPMAWLPPEAVKLTVRTANSALELPCRPPRPEDEELRHFAEPRGARPPTVTRLEPGHHTWLVHRDLATDEARLEVIDDAGRVRIEEIDLDVTRGTWESYSTRGRDPLSARGETRTVRGFRRDGWDVRVEIHTVLTSEIDHFRLRAELDAYEDGTRVRSRNWDRRIPRQLL
ncbi:MAG: CocE/NonD family hydrolase [Iamia sp.]